MKPIPVTIEDFNGLYDRGNDTATPKDYFNGCLNISIGNGEINTRAGSTKVIETPAIVRYHEYLKIGENPRKLYLSDTGSLYDSLYPNDPLITNTDFLDFSLAQQYNRAYITFHNGVTGLPGVSLYVYDGSGPSGFRLAGGSPPSGFSLVVTTSALSGNIEVGTHLFAVAYETDSGFITAYGPEIFAVYDAPGDFQADLSAIPIGPAGTIRRRLMATKAIVDYNGNQFGYVMYAIPEEAGGIIDNNTDTTATVNFFDAQLVDDVDYLLDNLSLIPAGVMINVYSNRLVVGGQNLTPHLVWVSDATTPETFNSLYGYIITDPSDEKSGVKNSIVFRNLLYIQKSNKTISYSDNGNYANTWQPTEVDGLIGAGPFSISSVGSSSETTNDRFFQGDPSGLFVFEGFFKRPELSWNIANVWSRINKNYFHKVQIAHDAENYQIYVGVPLDSATNISHILVGNYQDAFNPLGFLIPQKVEWSIWEFPSILCSISTNYEANTKIMQFNFGYLTGDICVIDPLTETDSYAGDEYLVDWFIEWGPLTYGVDPKYIYKVLDVVLQLQGSGQADILMHGLNDGFQATFPSLNLTALPTGFFRRPLSYVNEKPYFKLRGNNTGDILTSLNSVAFQLVPQWKVFNA